LALAEAEARLPDSLSASDAVLHDASYAAPRAGSTRELERPAARVLAAARTLLRDLGLAHLNMAAIAEKAGCSRPAVYQYFTNKEEVVAALAIESAALRNRLYQRVSSFDARSREQLVALAEVDAVLYPDWPVLEETTYANALRGRTSMARRDDLRREQRVAYESFMRCVSKGIAAGDLELPPKVDADQLVFTLSTFSTGLFAPMSRGLPDLVDRRPDPRAAMRRLGSAFLDGLGWRPLTSEWDYRRTLHRVYTEVFPADLLYELGLESSRSINEAPRRGRGRAVDLFRSDQP
jgi:AcrR family transcriptional regulator